MSLKPNLADFRYDEFSALLPDGTPKFRADQLFTAVMQYKAENEISNLPKDLLNSLSEKYFFRAVEIAETRTGKDGTEKYLFRLNDGELIEGVFMPHSYGNTLCVSTQAGCRMGCAFCASGLYGLSRNLTAGEILSQVLAVNSLKGGTLAKREITNIVLMGSGEPLDNYDNVLKFLHLVSDKKGINISPRNISLSTCGLAPNIRRLADTGLPVVLTISLHASTDEEREKLMPVNKAYKLNEVIDAAKYYFDKTGRRIIFEYSLIEGNNSSKEKALKLAELVKGLPCHINLINLNPVREKNLKGVRGDTIKEFMNTLTEKGISNTLRRSMGNDIQGACGQLRNKFVQ